MAVRNDSQLQAIIGRALVDTDFRARLVKDVRGTLAAEQFSLDEATILAIEEVAADQEKVVGFTQAFDDAFLARADYVS